MTDSENRRRFDRYIADGVNCSFSYSVEALVLNISLGGFAVRTGTQLSVGRMYRFRLGAGSDAVHLSGAVRWCRMAGTEKQETGDIVPVYEAGVAFDEVFSDQADHLRSFMEKSIIVDVKKRIFGRFKADQTEAVRLEAESGFLVRQISRTGVLVEAEIPLKQEEVIDLELRLGRRKFASTARVAHVAEIKVEDDNLQYRLGLEFIKTEQKYRDLLEDFIRGQVEEEKAEGTGERDE